MTSHTICLSQLMPVLDLVRANGKPITALFVNSSRAIGIHRCQIRKNYSTEVVSRPLAPFAVLDNPRIAATIPPPEGMA